MPARRSHSLRAQLLGRASLVAMLAGGAAVPRAMAGGSYLNLQQALASASSAAGRTTGNTAAITAGQQAAIGVSNLQAAVKRFASLQQALAAQAGKAAAQGSTVPNGIGACGLQPASGYNQAGAGVWLGVSGTAPITETTQGGTTNVTINQTSSQAVLNWTSFNVGSHTHLNFNQSAGGAAASSWTVLNRIDGPGVTPSMIFGSITAPGQVLVLNPYGVLFGDGAQVNLHSLVAGAISLTNQQFLSTGIYGVYGSVKSPAVAAGSAVIVEPGASITTAAPANASDGGGSVLLLAASVDNAGTIETPGGQTVLGGGSYFTLQTGYSVPANSTVTPGVCATHSACSTVLGTEIDASGTGSVINTGFIAATTGDITMAGQTLTQAGVLYSTTSVSRRGTIHLLSDTTDPKSSVTLAPGSLTYIAPDPNSLSADLSQRDDTPQEAYGGKSLLADQAGLADRPDRSRIEITTGGTVNFEDGSITLANAGQVAVSAVAPTAAKGTAQTQGQIFVADGAEIDVSGLNDVILPMSANTVQVSVQGFQLRDAPVNRDTGSLANLDLTLDARQLIYVAPSTSDNQARDYTAGGLFEVSGEVSQIAHSIAEWSTVGGSVALQGDAVVAQPGSTVNIAGGTIQYQAGQIAQTYLIGPGGTLYNANTAPANLLYTGVYDGFSVDHARWHVTDNYASPLLTPKSLFEPAYLEGRDAGTLTLIAPTALFEGTINAGVQTGPLQDVSHSSVASGTDPVSIGQDIAPLAGALVLADTPYPGSTTLPSFPTNVVIGAAETAAATLTAGQALAASFTDIVGFSSKQLDGLGSLVIEVGGATTKGANLGSIDVTGALTLATGGTLTLAAPVIEIGAPITARSGSVLVETENPLPGAAVGTLTAYSTKQRGTLTLAAGGSIDTRGLWTNLVSDPAATSGAAFINGGNVALMSDGALMLEKGSSIDASAGAVFAPAVNGGHGGNITLAADDPTLVGFTSSTTQQAAALAPVLLDGTVNSLGVSAGGTFSLAAPSILISKDAVPASPIEVALAPSFFASGFSGYVLNGFATPQTGPGGAGSAAGVVVAPGTAIDVVEPVLQATPFALLSPTGTDPDVPLSPVLYQEFLLNPVTHSFQRRAGASLTIESQFSGTSGGVLPQTGSGITIGQGASITVDAGQSVTLQSPSQITVEGAIHAPAGTISILNDGSSANVDPNAAARTSIWIGATATLDAAGESITGLSETGQPIGEVFNGGSILIGASGNINDLTSFASAAAYIFVRQGAVLDASGASAKLDLLAGTDLGGQSAADGLAQVGSAGGTIAFASDFGIYLDGTMQAQAGSAQAGSAQAAGGELAIRLGDPGYVSTSTSWPSWAFTPHQIVVSQDTTPTPLPANLAPGNGSFATESGANGQAAISAAQISQGGFGSLLLLARDQIVFNGSVTLSATQSITLADYTTANTKTSGTVDIVAPYVLLAGAPEPSGLTSSSSPYIVFDNTNPGGGTNDGQAFSKRAPCISGIAACYDATLTVRADLIDLQGDVRENGAYAKFYTGPTAANEPVLNSYGFNTVSLISGGDIRFVPSNYTNTNTSEANGLTLKDASIETAGDLVLDAARIYPATGVDAAAAAGINFWGGRDADQKKLAANLFYYGGSLVIGRTGDDASAPLSAFGRLGLSAATIVQGGTVDAPLGQIGLGLLSGEFPAVRNLSSTQAQVVSVTLAPGSITSVSADGLTIPFGGTTDGTSYSYDGQALTLPGASLGGIASVLPSVQFNASQISVASGATVDLEGGGTLAGGGGELNESSSGSVSLVSQGFITGRGGSTDTLTTPFITFNAKTLTATTPSLAQEPVYAILPGYASGYAPVASLEVPTTGANGVTTSYYGSLPGVGDQVTIGAGVPGLAAGTYTLLPSYYALLPGAYRVQLGTGAPVAGAVPAITGSTVSLGDGTYETTASLGVAGTSVQNVTPSTILVTPGSVVATYSQYDTEGYAAYGVANAGLFGNPRPFLPVDAGAILVTLGELSTKTGRLLPETSPGFSFDGTALTAAAPGGYSADLVIVPGSTSGLDILAAGDAPRAGDVGVLASTIDAVGAPAVFLGNTFSTPSQSVSTPGNSAAATNVTVEGGATLSAGAVFLLASGSIDVDAGAVITTIGHDVDLPDSATGVLFSPNTQANSGIKPDAILAVANGDYDFPFAATGTATINLGVCAAASGCAGTPTELLSGGFLGLLAGGPTSIAPGVVFGARDLELDTSTITIGTPSGTEAATGATLTQATLQQLIAGDAAAGIPSLGTLQLTASSSLDFAPGGSLDTLNPLTGISSLGSLVITTPAFYGSGAAGDTASITTGTLVWTGVSSTGTASVPPPGFGTGTGTLAVDAKTIVIGYSGQAQAQNQVTLQNAVQGFASVDFAATDMFTANNHANLSVLGNPTVSGSGTGVSGGDLTITTPLLTTAAGAVLGITASGEIDLAASAAPAGTTQTGGLGGEIDLTAASLVDATRIALPSGRLTANATGDIVLESGAVIDLAGPTISIIDQQRGSFGGTAQLISQTGNITEAAGASIDISATDGNAGTLSATARKGLVNLMGSLSAGAPGGFEAGSVGITASSLGDASQFQALNTMLDGAGAFFARSFEQVGVGDLTVGNVTAQNVSISVDGGALTVAGTIDASGAAPGSIDLAATGNLTLAPTALLEAQESAVHTDSFGQLILAENTPHIELQVASNTATPGTLTIESGAAIDMAGPDGLALGQLELDVARTKNDKNADIEAAGKFTITGAAEIDVNAFKTYVAGQSVVNKDGKITQATLDTINQSSKSFIASAEQGGSLRGALASELSGLVAADAAALHLRPGVEIDSGASGDLTVSGVLNLAAFRYGSINPDVAQPNASAYGSGEPGVLWLRAANTLTVAGDITDGFAPPPPVTIAGVTLDHLWAVAPMLAAGDLSWSMRLVAGADLAGADSRDILGPDIAGSAAAGGGGNLVLSDKSILPNNGNNYSARIDVVRTGTGYLDLYAGGNFTEDSPFGIYTAGTQIAGAPNAAGENFTTGGGDVTLVAGGTAQGFVSPLDNNGETEYSATYFTNDLVNWLHDDSKAWWVDFGRIGNEFLFAPNGLGTFGGGNVDVTVGGDAGNLSTDASSANNPAGGGLDITVASTGYVESTTGSVIVSGGGDIRLNVGGILNPSGTNPNFPQFGNWYGAITDLRGQVSILAGSVGQVSLLYAPIANDPRPVNPFVSETFQATGGPTLILGDAHADIDTRGDLVLGGVGDGGGMLFSFYQPTTSLSLYSAGGNLVPAALFAGTLDPDITNDASQNKLLNNTFYYYAPILDAVAGSGNIYLADSTGNSGIQLAPSADGALDILAEGSIYDGAVLGTFQEQQLRIEMSGAPARSASPLPGPLLPVRSLKGTGIQANESSATASGTLHVGDSQPSRFYAASGDIVGLETGFLGTTVAGNAYEAATAVQIIAGQDVVDTGGQSYLQGATAATAVATTTGDGPDLFLNNNPADISLIKAGRDVIYANADVAGPGTLLVEAGRNVYQGDTGILLSLGEIGQALTPETREAGAGITVLAGLSGGFDTTGFADLYLNAANLANAAIPLQDQKGKVERTYQTQLYAWLAARGYTGTQEGALAYFLSLPQYEQTVFLLTVYYAELNQSGLDYNNPQSRFYHSYLEGSEAVSALFPSTDLTGKAPANGGGLTLFSGQTTVQNQNSFETDFYDSAIRTEFGGAITTLVPYGQTLLGNYGIVPQATAGILTQGSGDIDMYSYGSVILGQSRVLTTLGGNVLIWMSSDGEINAGRGSKTTALTPPPNISYDIYGNIFLSPTVPSSGAGIGALAPIAGVPAGDVNLIAPVGSIDAGEAGVRASGNINVAALTVVNGANLQSGGKTTGVPTVSAPSAASVAAASATSGQSQAAAQVQAQRPAPPEPSVIEVEVLVGGAEEATPDERKKRKHSGA
jgi:filamentous hemagglutinin family protein